MTGLKLGGAMLLLGVLATPALADNPTTKPPCMWAGGLFSPGAALCVGNGQALVCDNGEWHPATDANTTAYSWSMTDRPARTETAIKDIAVGADVVIWSNSQTDGSFLAERIAVVPAATSATSPDASPAASPAAG